MSLLAQLFVPFIQDLPVVRKRKIVPLSTAGQEPFRVVEEKAQEVQTSLKREEEPPDLSQSLVQGNTEHKTPTDCAIFLEISESRFLNSLLVEIPECSLDRILTP